ncbi:MAG: hypothetical protein ACP5TY_00380 [Thermodesulforhabdaceae bacterium]|jgi:hypothetical protein
MAGITVGSTGNTSSVSSTNLNINDWSPDVLAFYLAIQQTQNLDQQINDKLQQIQGKQADMAKAREYLAKMKELQNLAGDNGITRMPDDMKKWLNDHGISYDRTGNDDMHSKKDWDINIEHLNAYIQNNNSSVELDMLSIQSLMNKRNQALEMASTIMKKSAELKESILRNI